MITMLQRLIQRILIDDDETARRRPPLSVEGEEDSLRWPPSSHRVELPFQLLVLDMMVEASLFRPSNLSDIYFSLSSSPFVLPSPCRYSVPHIGRGGMNGGWLPSAYKIFFNFQGAAAVLFTPLRLCQRWHCAACCAICAASSGGSSSGVSATETLFSISYDYKTTNT